MIDEDPDRLAFWMHPGTHEMVPIERVQDYPLLAVCLEVWRRSVRDGLPPRLDPLAVPRAVVKGINLFERDARTGEWVVRLAGSLLTEGHGREIRGTDLSEGFSPVDLEKVKQGIDRAVAAGEPRLVRRSFRDPRGLSWSYTQLILPLSSDGYRRDRYATVIDPETFGRFHDD